ncbi:PPE family protein [Mycobacterium tuberculosis CAS/NITR204]|uniref:PPE family protein n=1 Tax=Mycobacterium tuberculosis CAS/NITR204 TaxID=1310114 RepID=R4MAD5_MYCTX|nr:PPE family protein [Mycobacterium tuberculosis CAS/NITR204]
MVGGAVEAAGWFGVAMILDFSWLPPEINSARIYAGAGSGPLFMAAAAWEGLAADLRASASSFDAVIAGLAAGPWSGPASVAMAGAAAPYVGWLSAAAGQAELSAGQATAAATAFDGVGGHGASGGGDGESGVVGGVGGDEHFGSEHAGDCGH